MSICLFPQLQVHLYNYFLKRCGKKGNLWSDGFAVALRYSNAVGIVEARHEQLAIDIIVRGSRQAERQSYALLHTVKEETLLKAKHFSPGSDITERVLSARELSSLDWTKSTPVPQITYDKGDVETAMETSGVIGPDDSLQAPEDAFSLLAIPPTHVRLMSTEFYRRFCRRMNRSSKCGEGNWRDLAYRLGMRRHEMPPRGKSRSIDCDPTDYILQWWSRRSGRHTIERLLAEVKAINHPEATAVLREELALRLDFMPPGEAVAERDSSESEASDSVTASNDSADEATPTASAPTDQTKTSYCLETDQTMMFPDVTTARLFLDIARCFSHMNDCEQLAVHLEISQGRAFISLLQDRNPRVRVVEAAYEVLTKWKMEKGSHASLEELYRVLRDQMNMRETAERFEQDCTRCL